MGMRGKKAAIGKIFLSVSILSALFVLTEIVLQSAGKSICSSVGCKVVARYARFGDISLLLAGLLTFSLLAAFTVISLYFNKPAFEKYINLVLTVSLACEGFLTGYQAFRIHLPCTFCLAVFGLLVILGLLRLFSGEKEIVAGFAAMAAVFSLLYLILPAENTVRIPEDKQFVLFYSRDCKYCAAVMNELNESKIPVDHVLVNEYAGFLQRMGIEHVPTLYVNNKNEKIFLTGKDEIENYLLSRPKEGTAATGAVKRRKTTMPAGKSGGPAMKGILNSRDESFPLVLPSSEAGMCKENEECK